LQLLFIKKSEDRSSDVFVGCRTFGPAWNG